ncbi:MAG: FlgO family outer membrane protein [Spirochaetota bacterium]
MKVFQYTSILEAKLVCNKIYQIVLSISLLALANCQSLFFTPSPDYDIDASAKELKEKLLKNFHFREKKVLAIASFARTDLIRPNSRYKSVIPKLGVYYANALQNEMFQPQLFTLVERQRIDGLLNEVSYQQLGMTSNPIGSIELGGADLILLGTIQKRQNSFRIDARIVELKTGTIVSVATSLVATSPSITQLYEDYPEAIKEYSSLIMAASGWQTIDAPIYPPAEVSIKAKGNWSMTNNRKSFDASGSTENPSFFGDYRIDKLFNHGQLICRFNTHPGEVFSIGTVQMARKGYVECRMNDTDIDNNVGSQTITLTVDERKK